MATMYSAGGRRSSAPQVTITPAQRSAVVNQLVASMTATASPQAPVAPKITQPAAKPVNSTAPTTQAKPSNSTAKSGSGGNYSSSSLGTTDPGGFRKALSALQGASMLAGDAGAAQAFGTIGTIAGVASAPSLQAAAIGLAPTALNAIGVPGPVIGLGMAALNRDPAAALNAALMATGPLGLVNQIAESLTGVSIGTAAFGNKQDASLGSSVLGKDASYVDRADAGAAINSSPDPLGALISQLPGMSTGSDSNSDSSSDSAGSGYGVTGNRSNLPGSGGGGFRGGYGGGIGQSGGNASGMGSSQA